MFSGNTESGITAAYQDADNTVDLTVTDAPLLGGQNSAFHLDRTNHSGTQDSTTISDFETAVEALIPTGFIVTREYDSGTGWPARGTVPTGSIVMWINRVDDTLPSTGGSGAVEDVDIVLVNLAA